MNQNMEYIDGQIIKSEAFFPEYETENGIQKASDPLYKYQIVEKKSGNILNISDDNRSFQTGTKVYLSKLNLGNEEKYFIVDKNRNFEIFSLLFLFIFIVVVIFGKKGLRALLSLSISILTIFYILIPLTLAGYNPLLVASLVSSALLFIMMAITHGINRVTLSALFGCISAITLTIFLSLITTEYSQLTGFVDESSAYLKFGLATPIELTSLIMASIVIGVVGAIDDGTITQAKIVAEIKSLNNKISIRECYNRAMAIGLEHGGAMINTLLLAYIASSFNILLFFYTSTINPIVLLSSEMIVVEIFRSLISSIGLLIAIPITTYLAAHFLTEKDILHHESHHKHRH